MQVNEPQVVQSDEAQIEALIQQMTLAEKIGQMTQAEKDSIPPADVATYFIGSVLSGGGGSPTPNTPENWAAMVRAYQEAALSTRLAIPMIYGVDAVHGHGNCAGAVIFPHNIAMGATRDADLVQRIAHVTARELMATGIHWNFAPAVSVPQDIRWGRSYEGYSEQTEIVTPLAVHYMQGLQDGDPRVLASVKHFVADGGTGWKTTRTYDWLGANWQAPGAGYSIDQGDAQIDEATLRRVHLPPYLAAIEAGAVNIMVSFSSWQGTKMHAHRYLINDVLKGEYGFNGFVVSDWMAVSQIDRDYTTSVVAAINAGIDMVMVPYDYKAFIDTLMRAVESGAVTMSRIDDAVRRILRAKFWVGLFELPFGRHDLLPDVGSPAHREVAREAVRKSLVLLKNDGATLPIKKSAQILVAGRGADNIGMQCGGWSITWQGGHGAITSGTNILNAVAQAVEDEEQVAYSADGTLSQGARADVGIVVVGESPYAEGLGDSDDLTLSAEDRAAIHNARAVCDKVVVVLLSGRPMVITDVLPLVDAFVAAWQPGTEGQGVSDVLFGDYPFVGRLSFSWLRSMAQLPLATLQADPEGALFPVGYGLS